MKKRRCSILDYLSSITFTLIILTLLTLTASLAMIGDDLLDIFKGYGLSRNGPLLGIFNLFACSGLSTSWWFKTLFFLFSLNLFTCTVKRIPSTVNILGHPGPGRNTTLPANLCYRKSFLLTAPHRDCEERCYRLLSEKWSRPLLHREGNRSVFFSQKGRCAHMGFYCAHLSLLVLLAGGMVGRASYHGEVSLREGETSNTVFTKKDGEPAITKLDFCMRLDRTGSVSPGKEGKHSRGKSYQSTITIVEQGKRIKTLGLAGYQTFNHKGVRIAQSGFTDPGSERVYLSVTPKVPGAQRRIHTVGRHDCFTVPETGHTIRVRNILSPPPSPVDEKKPGTSGAGPQGRAALLSGHLVTLEVYGTHNKLLHTPFVSSKQQKDHHPWDGDYAFSLLGIEQDTLPCRIWFHLSFEPGAHIIWASLYGAILGFAMMFTLSHRKLWVVLEGRGSSVHITLAGWASRNPENLRSTIATLRRDLGL